MSVAILIFALSLLGIITLFSLKAWEERSSRTLVPSMRAKADEGARTVKILLARSQVEARKLPPELLILARTILHDAALGAAAVARFLERQSHRLADKVSHKAGFERRETNSDFLKNVSEYKGGNGRDLDTPTSDTGSESGSRP